MEKNLDNIFDRFYPRSQTVEQGIFLKRLFGQLKSY